MKILVIGSGGMLGHVLTLYLKEKGHDVSDISKRRKCNRETILMNVLDFHSFDNFLDNNEFDFIVNCAAILSGECEKNKKDAILLNSYFPHYLEKRCINLKTRIIQVSTAGVFDGKCGGYMEDCKCDTKSFYGMTKLLGELTDGKNLTVRSDFVGPDMYSEGRGLFNWIMKSKCEINGYCMAYFNGVTSLELAEFIDLALKKNYRGVYHLYTMDINSKANFARMICEVFGKEDLSVKDCEDVCVDMTLKSSRNDIEYIQKNMETQLVELKNWMEKNKNIYEHYFDNEDR